MRFGLSPLQGGAPFEQTILECERACALAGPAFLDFFEHTCFRWPHPIVKRPPGELSIERLAEDRLVLGDPATCVTELQRLQQQAGIDYVICRMSAAGIPPEAVRRSHDLFVREGMPVLSGG